MDQHTYRLFKRTLIWLAALLLFALVIAQAFPAAGQEGFVTAPTTTISAN